MQGSEKTSGNSKKLELSQLSLDPREQFQIILKAGWKNSTSKVA